jgi:hypothetical protein
MGNAFTSTNLTSTLIFARACVRDINPASLTDEQIGLLHEIANFACANAQEARLLEGSDHALIQSFEEDEPWVAESDALDHSIGHEDRFVDSYWESLTDIGEIGHSEL